jgi:hypothetical protein
MTNHKEEIEYLMLFRNIHEEFLDNKIKIKPHLKDFYVDYENWKINENGTGFSNIWLEPKTELIYKPAFKSPFEEIEVKGLRIIIKTKVLTIKSGHKILNFEMSANFNPNIWRGRNGSNFQPVGETIVSGYNRVIIEQDNLLSPYFLKYIDQNSANFVLTTVNFFSQKTKKSN